MSDANRAERTEAVNELKRSLILKAARRVFESDGLDKASMRAIAKEAGYTAGAIYFHFDSKEAIYAAILREVLQRLLASVGEAIAGVAAPLGRFEAAALAFFDFFAQDPRDLDYGFYLLGGGLRPRGISHETDAELNALLEASLDPLTQVAAELGMSEQDGKGLAASVFAHAAGLLLLKHTHRIRMFRAEPRALMRDFIERLAADLKARQA